MALTIIAGYKRGLKLKIPPPQLTRPTQSLIREAIFNVLGRDACPNARVLDLFAGSGAMGLEAISRGAQSALFVENNKQVIKTLQENIALFPDKDLRILKATLPQDFQKILGLFDLIFMDPPYEMGLAPSEFLAYASAHSLVAPKANLVWEMDAIHLKSLNEIETSPFELFQEKNYGAKACAFFRMPIS
ncbi:MAG: 16S rRNA (guanine(966)-N(2))-methyltransferase RsmD [Deltaproteobacteria bacterium]|jgi:16S rRNA (guanine966-N2)-methyltransferase|nr:16S rRNA (guanine(966)-N(2))-methyltransferase RsmD [Deltaproteobacteria bacterium]